MSEIGHLPEQEAKREVFLAELTAFIIEAGQNGWAAGAPKIENPQRPGFKELTYQSENGDWEYRDSYAGYYMAPGSSVVYFRERPVWYMTYGGEGQLPEFYDQAKETYAFLRRALMEPDLRFPVRGPLVHREDNDRRLYWFDFNGDLEQGSWTESVLFDHVRIFGQRGDVGLIIDKGKNRDPLFPWDL